MADIGFKVMRDGASVTSTDLRDYVIHSKYKNPKVLPIGTQAITTDASGNFVFTLAHGLGYAPMHMVQLKVAGKWYDVTSFGAIFDTVSGNGSYVWSFTDATNLYVYSAFGYWPSVQSWTLKYLLIIDQR
jgi:hypothetical protein